LRAPDARAAVPHHAGPNELEYPRGRGPVTLDRVGDGEFQLVCCTCHRIRGASRYTRVLRGHDLSLGARDAVCLWTFVLLRRTQDTCVTKCATVGPVSAQRNRCTPRGPRHSSPDTDGPRPRCPRGRRPSTPVCHAPGAAVSPVRQCECPACASADSSSGLSTMAVSVVSIIRATEQALTTAEWVTLTGSITPAETRSPYSPVAALKPSRGPSSRTLLTTTEPSSPALDAIQNNGAVSALRTTFTPTASS